MVTLREIAASSGESKCLPSRRSARIMKNLMDEANRKASVKEDKSILDNGNIRKNEKKVNKKRSRSGKNKENHSEISLIESKIDSSMAPSERVKETLRIFHSLYLQFIPIEENRCRDWNENRNSQQEQIIKGCKPRPDLKTIGVMKKTNAILYPEKQIGDLPGIDAGYTFFSRSEMYVLGFHHQTMRGIDFIPKPPKTTTNELVSKVENFPIAVSIIMSGQYEDDLDNGNEIIYTGEGGNDLLGQKHQVKDQKMQGGNLALKNCIAEGVPVRVIRGRKCNDSYVKKVYEYDGLYKVVDHWSDRGVSEHLVEKFKLKRIDYQESFTTVHPVHAKPRNILKGKIKQQRYVCQDLSGGLETIPIPVINTVDNPPTVPEGFTYIKTMQVSENVDYPRTAPAGCTCQGKCVNSRTCACAKLNGGDFPYVTKDGGRLIKAKDVIFECGPHCGCGPECVNRTSQKGLRYRLEVFRTPNMGWGVRSLDYIPSGAPVCEYIGLLKRTADLDLAADSSYVFDIDCLHTMKGLEGRESRLINVSLPSHIQDQLDQESAENVPFCIDGGQSGSVTRFINHSCEPNLFVQCMVNEHHDLRFARVILVAADNIPPLQELSYDYGYALDSVRGPDGNIRQLPCLCGAKKCRKRLY